MFWTSDNIFGALSVILSIIALYISILQYYSSRYSNLISRLSKKESYSELLVYFSEESTSNLYRKYNYIVIGVINKIFGYKVMKLSYEIAPLKRCFYVVMIYPIFFLFFSYILGITGNIGGIQIFPELKGFWFRFLFILIISIGLLLSILLYFNQKRIFFFLLYYVRGFFLFYSRHMSIGNNHARFDKILAIRSVTTLLFAVFNILSLFLITFILYIPYSIQYIEWTPMQPIPNNAELAFFGTVVSVVLCLSIVFRASLSLYKCVDRRVARKYRRATVLYRLMLLMIRTVNAVGIISIVILVSLLFFVIFYFAHTTSFGSAVLFLCILYHFRFAML